jgi:hypothetical protein
MVPFTQLVVLFARWFSGEWDNVGPLHNSMQHFRLECNHNGKKYILLRKDQPFQKWHGDNYSTTEYGVLAHFPFCGPIHPNLPQDQTNLYLT